MATIQKRKNGDGSTSFMAWVRIKGFKTATQAFPDRARAKAWADKHEIELRLQRKIGAVRPDVSTLTVACLAQEFLGDPETERLAYFPDLTNQLAWWVDKYGTERLEGFGVFLIREARTKLLVGRKPATANRYLSAMRRAFNWGRNAGLVLDNRSWPHEVMMTEPRGRTRYLDDRELARLLGAARDHSACMYAAVLVSIGTGVRQGELLRLTWKDVDLDKGQLRVLLSKNGDPRVVHVPAPAIAALQTLRRSGVVSAQGLFITETGKPLDQNRLEHRWKRIRSAASLSNFRWHDLRHSAASYLAQNGASLLEIGSVLGHRSPSVTMRYAHLVKGKPVTGADKLAEKLEAHL